MRSITQIVLTILLLALICAWTAELISVRAQHAGMRERFKEPTLVELPDGSKWIIQHTLGVNCEVHPVQETK